MDKFLIKFSWDNYDRTYPLIKRLKLEKSYCNLYPLKLIEDWNYISGGLQYSKITITNAGDAISMKDKKIALYFFTFSYLIILITKWWYSDYRLLR